ncbi:hypothetical protein [Microbispora sp. CSR-4]|uniref:hypothetical protein n=1 Tax=Microbispora sp. CSR-4 TaxID=2592813 RepID=UPI0011CB80BC|nr:hypothetical protein [Microbispora sp. CSR-4]
MLDLGNGAGAVCFIASQAVGSAGSVLRIDIDDDMLSVRHGACALYRGPLATVAHGTGLRLVLRGRFLSGRRTCDDPEGNRDC